jgi:hypothetical protein
MVERRERLRPVEDHMNKEEKWLLGYVALFLILAFAAETDMGPAAAALAVLISGSATFALLPTSMKELGFIQ